MDKFVDLGAKRLFEAWAYYVLEKKLERLALKDDDNDNGQGDRIDDENK